MRPNRPQQQVYIWDLIGKRHNNVERFEGYLVGPLCCHAVAQHSLTSAISTVNEETQDHPLRVLEA